MIVLPGFETEQPHNKAIAQKVQAWNSKPLLRKIYRHFYELIRLEIDPAAQTTIVEIGSGIGTLKTIIPDCLSTDLFAKPWIDIVQNAYALSFSQASISHLILLDIFHHLQYPGDALEEFRRVLIPQGKVILFEPYISPLSYIIYGLLHHEPVHFFSHLNWRSTGKPINKNAYFAAQGNATRIFFQKKYQDRLKNWTIVKRKRMPALYYLASGGYSQPQLYPELFFPLFLKSDRLLSVLNPLLASRVLIVLQKR